MPQNLDNVLGFLSDLHLHSHKMDNVGPTSHGSFLEVQLREWDQVCMNVGMDKIILE